MLLESCTEDSVENSGSFQFHRRIKQKRECLRNLTKDVR